MASNPVRYRRGTPEKTSSDSSKEVHSAPNEAALRASVLIRHDGSGNSSGDEQTKTTAELAKNKVTT